MCDYIKLYFCSDLKLYLLIKDYNKKQDELEKGEEQYEIIQENIANKDLFNEQPKKQCNLSFKTQILKHKY